MMKWVLEVLYINIIILVGLKNGKMKCVVTCQKSKYQPIACILRISQEGKACDI